jgi:hypothetical protein
LRQVDQSSMALSARVVTDGQICALARATLWSG